MRSAKIAVTMNQDLLARLDRLVRSKRFSNRSRAIREVLEEKLAALDASGLARECAKLDPASEQELAEEGISADFKQWPAY